MNTIRGFDLKITQHRSQVNDKYHELESNVVSIILRTIESKNSTQAEYLRKCTNHFNIPFLLKNSWLSKEEWARLYISIYDDLFQILILRRALAQYYTSIGQQCNAHDLIVQDYEGLLAVSMLSGGIGPDQFSHKYIVF